MSNRNQSQSIKEMTTLKKYEVNFDRMDICGLLITKFKFDNELTDLQNSSLNNKNCYYTKEAKKHNSFTHKFVRRA